MLATQVILCATLIGNVFLFAVVLRERASGFKITFGLYLLSIFAWTFCIYINLFLSSTAVEEWIFATAAAVLTLQVRFALLFPLEGPVAHRVNSFVLAIGSAFTLASFYPGALFVSIAIHAQGYTTLDTGPLSSAYSLFAVSFVCAPIAILLYKYKKERDELQRAQLRYLTIGFTGFAIIAVAANSVLPVFFGIYDLNAIGPLFSLVFAAAILLIIQLRERSREVDVRVEERTTNMRKAQESERQMMLDIAHGLQTPLTIFRTRLESQGATEGDFQHEPLKESLTALTVFVDDLLKLAHLEHAPTNELREVDLSEVVRAICADVSVVANARHIQLLSDIAPICLVRGDERELRLAILNLLSNSIKYTREDERVIEVTLASNDGNVVLMVRDTGVGIASEYFRTFSIVFIVRPHRT